MLPKIEITLPESISKDTLKQILKHYKFYNRTQLISALRLITPKNQSPYHLTQDTDILPLLTDKDLRSMVYQQTRKRLKAIIKQSKTKKSKINKKG